MQCDVEKYLVDAPYVLYQGLTNLDLSHLTYREQILLFTFSA